ncbi:MAG: class I SAM-dependent methyltransferase, partial [Firmicutes bacterium]|nr:class I SAM-dependent methyltransferase [Bacillota bacterium]
ASENYGIQVISGTLEDEVFAPGSFDLVTMWDVIEHLPNPVHTLNIINKILKPAGVLTLTTGDIASLFAKISGAKWHLINIPEHVFYFNPKSIAEVLNKTGFKIIQIKYESSYYAVQYLLERLEKTMLPKSIVSLFKNIFPMEATLPMNLFDIMTVYAVKSD